MSILYVVFPVVLIVGFFSRHFISMQKMQKQAGSVKSRIDKVKFEAEQRAQRVQGQFKDRLKRDRFALEKDLQKLQHDLRRIEEKIKEKQSSEEQEQNKLVPLKEEVSALESHIEEEEKKIQELESSLNNVNEKEFADLEQMAGASCEEIKKEIIEKYEKGLQEKQAQAIQEELKRYQEKLDLEVKRILEMAIERTDVNHFSESTLTHISLPNDEIKGRIIGKEGCNIKALEKQCGVDIVIDEIPGILLLQNSDPMRREVARCTLEKLMQDGRINPERIQEVVERVRKEMDDIILDMGEEMLFSLGVREISREYVRKLGQLKFHHDKGQNALSHLKETVYLINTIVSELDEENVSVKKELLLHHLNKVDGSNGNESTEVKDLEKETLNPLIEAVDLISSHRPGAQSEKIQNYLSRFEKIEEMIHQLKGVKRCYCIGSKREIRVFVSPEELTDEDVKNLAIEIVKKIKASAPLSGQFKVMVIREVCSVEYVR